MFFDLWSLGLPIVMRSRTFEWHCGLTNYRTTEFCKLLKSAEVDSDAVSRYDNLRITVDDSQRFRTIRDFL